MPYNKIKIAVGAFVFVFSLMILSSSYFLLKAKGVFQEHFYYNFTAKSARFFSVGMPLQLSGFDIGIIEKIRLQNDGSVTIDFSVKKENLKWINKETYLMIKKPLIGSPYIEVHSKLGLEVLAEGTSIKMQTSDYINDMIDRLEPVVGKLTNIIDNVDTITSYLADNDSELLHILKNLDTFSANLLKDDALLTTITGDKNSTKNLVSTINETLTLAKELTKVVSDVSKISGKLDEEVVQPSSHSMKELESLLKDVKSKLERYDKELNSIKNEVSLSIQKSNKIIDKVGRLVDDKENNKVMLP